LQVHEWSKWEAEIQASQADAKRQLLPLDSRLHREIEGDSVKHAAAIAVGMFTRDLFRSPVTKAVYKNLRIMFIERMHFDYEFDFGTFINR
jgi:hypothetical protein